MKCHLYLNEMMEREEDSAFDSANPPPAPSPFSLKDFEFFTPPNLIIEQEYESQASQSHPKIQKKMKKNNYLPKSLFILQHQNGKNRFKIIVDDDDDDDDNDDDKDSTRTDSLLPTSVLDRELQQEEEAAAKKMNLKENLVELDNLGAKVTEKCYTVSEKTPKSKVEQLLSAEKRKDPLRARRILKVKRMVRNSTIKDEPNLENIVAGCNKFREFSSKNYFNNEPACSQQKMLNSDSQSTYSISNNAGVASSVSNNVSTSNSDVASVSNSVDPGSNTSGVAISSNSGVTSVSNNDVGQVLNSNSSCPVANNVRPSFN